MRFLKLLLGVAAVGVVAAAFRDSARGRWLRPAVPFAGDDEDGGIALDGQEPVLGYDGMDRDTLLEWLRDAWPDQLPDDASGAFNKGWYINPLTLQGEASLYSDGDGNCCPSRVLYFRVRLEGDSLVLRDHRAVASPYK